MSNDPKIPERIERYTEISRNSVIPKSASERWLTRHNPTVNTKYTQPGQRIPSYQTTNFLYNQIGRVGSPPVLNGLDINSRLGSIETRYKKNFFRTQLLGDYQPSTRRVRAKLQRQLSKIEQSATQTHESVVYKIDEALANNPYFEEYAIDIEHKEIYLHRLGKQVIEKVKLKRVPNQFDSYDDKLQIPVPQMTRLKEQLSKRVVPKQRRPKLKRKRFPTRLFKSKTERRLQTADPVVSGGREKQKNINYKKLTNRLVPDFCSIFATASTDAGTSNLTQQNSPVRFELY